MKTNRNLLITMILVLSSLLAIQPAGAVGASALTRGDRSCDDIGPLPDRLVLLEFGSPDARTALKSALRAAPPCMDDGAPVDNAARNAPLTCNIAGPVASGPMLVSGFAPACMVSPKLLAPATGNDVRACDGSQPMQKHAHSCVSPD